MINHSKRQTLSKLGAAIMVTAVPASVLNASSEYTALPELLSRNKDAGTHCAYDGATQLSQVDFVVSTLGANSAVTTITNHSKAVVTVSRLAPVLVKHNNEHYNVNAAIGAKGISLKPGQKRMLIAIKVASFPA